MRQHYYDRESQGAEVKRIIGIYRNVAGHCPALCETVKAFDGKVYNKRLIAALEKATGLHIYVEKYANHYSFELREGGEWIIIGTMMIADMQDGKRINAEKVKESFHEKRDKLLKEAAEMEATMGLVDDIASQIESLKHTLDGVLKPVNWRIKEIYGLNYKIVNY